MKQRLALACAVTSTVLAVAGRTPTPATTKAPQCVAMTAKVTELGADPLAK